MGDVRVAWVTGAGGALGTAVVRRLAADGWCGVASVRREEGTLPPNWRGHTGRLDDPQAAGQAAAAALSAHGRLNLAVLAAGAWEGGASAHRSEPEAFERMWRANAESAWQCARAAAGAMVRGAAGGPRSIVLVGAFSALARPAPSGQTAYRAAKAATVALAEGLASDLADEGIAVFALAPTTLNTPANRHAMPEADASRWLSLDDVAEIVTFLATPAARALSGAVLPLDARVRS